VGGAGADREPDLSPAAETAAAETAAAETAAAETAAPPWQPHQPTVEWQVAGACNYDCSYCIQSPRFRRGRPRAEQLQAAIGGLAALPGTWEIKCSGGEAFAHPLFMEQVVPGLVQRTPHRISVLTNLSADRPTLMRFLAHTRGRLAVFSASLHLEQVDVAAFVDKARWLADQLDPDAAFVINQVVLPGREDQARASRDQVQAAGLRWFPQLYKVKRPPHLRPPGGDPMMVADYPDDAALRALIGEAPGPREANLAPSYLGRRCWAGVSYMVIDKEGEAWACRTARRHDQGYLGNAFDGSLRLGQAPTPCPYELCPCSVPANRGMIEGIGPAPD